MQPQALHLVTIRPKDMEATRDFYANVVQLTVGDRPPFDFPGYWLYVGDVPVIHLVGGGDPLNAYFGDEAGPDEDIAGGGAVDHVAFLFAPKDFEPMRSGFDSAGVDYHHMVVPGLGLRQIFLKDPDGIRVELNFPPE